MKWHGNGKQVSWEIMAGRFYVCLVLVKNDSMKFKCFKRFSSKPITNQLNFPQFSVLCGGYKNRFSLDEKQNIKRGEDLCQVMKILGSIKVICKTFSN